MSDSERKPDRPAAPWDATLVPGTEPAPGSEETPAGATRPMPLGPGQPNFTAFQPPPRRSVPLCCWVAVISSLTSVVLAVLLWARTPPAAVPATSPGPAGKPGAGAAGPPAEAFRAALQPYLDAAAKGDVHAMRMLGAMYYHGLDLPRNREEGLKWYRKAAQSGSKVAEQELKQLE